MKKQIQLLEYELPIAIVPLEEGGYLARCEKLQGCMAEGETVEEALRFVVDVARQIISLHKEERIEIPLQIVKHPVSSMIKDAGLSRELFLDL